MNPEKNISTAGAFPVHGRRRNALMLAGVIAGLLLLTAIQAQAQHHGGGPGGGFGGGMGGGMNGMGRSRGGDLEGGIGSQPMRSGPQMAPPGRWWDDNKTIKKLSLTTDQKQRMDDIFQTNKDALVNAYVSLQHEESRLNTMPWEDLQDPAKVDAAIDRVAQARTDLAKQAAHMQMQLRQQLTTAQLGKLHDEVSSLR